MNHNELLAFVSDQLKDDNGVVVIAARRSADGGVDLELISNIKPPSAICEVLKVSHRSIHDAHELDDDGVFKGAARA